MNIGWLKQYLFSAVHVVEMQCGNSTGYSKLKFLIVKVLLRPDELTVLLFNCNIFMMLCVVEPNPVVNVAASSSSTSFISVQWTRPGDNFDDFEIHVFDDDDKVVSNKSALKQATNTEVNGLTAGTLYTVKVYTRFAEVISEEMSSTVSTCK